MTTEHRKAYKHAHYMKNREAYVERAKAKRREKGKIVQEAKNKPCIDCNNSYPYYVMDFDHLKDKKFAIANCSGIDFDRLREEIKKCEVVCANCHRIRTYKRNNAMLVQWQNDRLSTD